MASASQALEIPSSFPFLRRLATISKVYPSSMRINRIRESFTRWAPKRNEFDRGLSSNVQRVTCQVCSFKMNVVQLEEHLQGKRHNRRLEKIASQYKMEVRQLPREVVEGTVPPNKLHEVLVAAKASPDARLLMEAQNLYSEQDSETTESTAMDEFPWVDKITEGTSLGRSLDHKLAKRMQELARIDRKLSQLESSRTKQYSEIPNVEDGATKAKIRGHVLWDGELGDISSGTTVRSPSLTLDTSNAHVSSVFRDERSLPSMEGEERSESASQLNPQGSRLRDLFQLRDNSDSGTLETSGRLADAEEASPFASVSGKALLDSAEKESTPFHGALGRTDDGVEYYLNTYEPFTCICVGVQGAGKSHTMAAIAESCMIQGSDLNRLGDPMTCLVLHYDLSSTNFCGMASMTQSAIPSSRAVVEKVVVLVSPYNYTERAKFYEGLPNVVVAPVQFRWESLTAPQIRTLMRVDPNEHMPLYMSCLLEVLRRYQRQGKVPPFEQFVRDITDGVNPRNTQEGPLHQRLFLLKELVGGEKSDETTESRNTNSVVAMDILGEKGTMVIADLTDPLLTPDEANHIFTVLVEKFLQVPVSHGKLLCVDEAHKFLSKASGSGAVGSLDRTLVDAVRQMRHYGLRIAVSSQSPLVFPNEMFELASFAVLHHFHSESWIEYLRKFLPLDASDVKDLVSLKQGEALLSSSKPVSIANPPRDVIETCLIPVVGAYGVPHGTDTAASQNSKVGGAKAMQSNCVRLKIRKRLTRDVGRSVVAATGTK